MASLHRWMLTAVWAAFGSAVLLASCGGDVATERDDDGGASALSATSAATTAATTGATTGATTTVGTATGGTTATTTSTGPATPCDHDCSLIQTPPCFVAVCNEGMHPGPVGQCVVVPMSDGTACDDGVFCAVDDVCISGACTGGPPNDCGMVPPPCAEIVCHETSQSCSVDPITLCKMSPDNCCPPGCTSNSDVDC
jgi:hypothetical protein